MMMFGGSPIRVAVPPMFEASASAIRNGTGAQPEPVADQQGDRCDEQHGGHVVQQRRRDGGDDHEHDHGGERAAAGSFGGPDGHVVEHAGLLQDADDHHHAQQQEDDVPVDAGLLTEERDPRVDHAEEHHCRGAGQGG